nr:hypothetical protein [Tanacetum cinerariifolium]
MNQNYFEPNPCYDFNSFDFDQFQPPQYSDVHQPSKEISIDELKIMMQSYFERMNQQREQEALQAAQREQELRDKSKQLKKNHHKTPTFVNLLENVENLVPIPSESEGILDHKGDVPFSDKNHFDAESDLIESFLTRDTLIVYSSKIDSLLEEFAGKLAHIDPIPLRIDETDSDPKDGIHFIEQLLYDDTSSEDDSFEGIDYVEVSPPDSELVSLEEVQDDILREKLLNIHLLIDKIDDHTKETSSGRTTTHVDNSLPEYDSFLFEIEPDQGELSIAAMEAILGEPRVYVPNVLPTHPTLCQDSDFSFSDDSLGSGLNVSFPSGTRNKIFDPGLFIEVQSERLLSWEEFSISFIRDPLYPVFKSGLPQIKKPLVFIVCLIIYPSFNLSYMGIRYPRSY